MLGKNIYKMRIALDLTQEELAELVGVTQKAISAFEKGIKVPSVATLSQLADVLGCSVDVLLGRNAKEVINHE